MARQQRSNPGLLFGDRNMNSMDMESVDSSESEDDEDYIPDHDGLDEESMGEDENTGESYDDDDELVGNISIEMNENNSMGPPMGTPGQGMAEENPGVEDTETEGEEHDDNNLTDPEVEYDENPGVADHESEGVGEVSHDAYINRVKDGNLNNLSTKIDMVENVTVDQDSGEENRVQGTPRYNLRKNHARSYQHVYHPKLYETEDGKQSDTGDIVLATVDEIPEDTPQMSMKKGLKMFGKGG